MDVVIPIVFPDYLIAVNTPPTEIDILPWFDFDDIRVPKTKNRVPELGHAGVLFINGKTGVTKYFEYGRYDRENLGLVRRIPISDVSTTEGKVVLKSLKKPLREISRKAGQGGRISGVYIEVEGKYQAMLTYAKLRMKQNVNKSREPYSLLSNSCIHFVKKVVEVAGVETPWMLDPRPNSYIGEFRDDYPDLDYERKTDILGIENLGKY